MREISSDDASASAPCESCRQVACAAAQIQYAGVFAEQNVSKSLGHAAAPDAIHLQGKRMVEEIVTWSDATEHLADALGGFAITARSRRPGSREGLWLQSGPPQLFRATRTGSSRSTSHITFSGISETVSERPIFEATTKRN